jgi:hypothetical protein
MFVGTEPEFIEDTAKSFALFVDDAKNGARDARANS